MPDNPNEASVEDAGRSATCRPAMPLASSCSCRILRPGLSPALAQSAYHIKTAENIVGVTENFAAEPAPHDEEGQDHGQQLDAEGQRLFLQLGGSPE